HLLDVDIYRQLDGFERPRVLAAGRRRDSARHVDPLRHALEHQLERQWRTLTNPDHFDLEIRWSRQGGVHPFPLTRIAEQAHRSEIEDEVTSLHTCPPGAFEDVAPAFTRDSPF